ncbi:protein of unknown function [Vibrio tapetis subsp. tapetis]|uniref:Uncharacterized protein n=1 Tax=Vibrio tapetis subsp. tapetis TaxID=1671868 RepID=A0A2N8ZBU8_9VIBR|nr:protein of unknown function [Vibrio tapetis subsp. tapetis]
MNAEPCQLISNASDGLTQSLLYEAYPNNVDVLIYTRGGVVQYLHHLQVV